MPWGGGDLSGAGGGAEPLAFRAVGNLFWFFTYRFTISPILIVAPIFALLGILVPLAVYRSVAKSTIVRRLQGGGSLT